MGFKIDISGMSSAIAALQKGKGADITGAELKNEGRWSVSVAGEAHPVEVGARGSEPRPRLNDGSVLYTDEDNNLWLDPPGPKTDPVLIAEATSTQGTMPASTTSTQGTMPPASTTSTQGTMPASNEDSQQQTAGQGTMPASADVQTISQGTMPPS